MPFIPHTQEEIGSMLQTIGVDSIDALFSEIPKPLHMIKPLGISAGLSEMQVTDHIKQKAAQNKLLANYIGAGSYEHFIPACVWDLTSRGEFMTAYTPYQAEAAQGNLQLIWEYQTMMASLMGLPVSNASLYDGATSVAEAVLMALRGRKKSSMNVYVPMNCHPHYREVLNTLLRPQNINLVEVPHAIQTGCIETSTLVNIAQETPCDVLILNQPNFFGQLEAADELTDWAHAQGAAVIGVVNPTAMSVLKPPGEWGQNGADIACGEGQPLGVPLHYGGPYFGFMCCQKKWLRQLPGRVVGRTTDLNGQPGFTLTLQAREQHIRRGKATSNICTNQGLLVTAATIYMSVMGSAGLQQVAQTAASNAHYLFEELTKLPGITPVFKGPFFHEFTVRFAKPVFQVLQHMQNQHIQAGLDITPYYPGLDNTLLICVTETKNKQQLDDYISTIKQIVD